MTYVPHVRGEATHNHENTTPEEQLMIPALYYP